MMMMEVVGCLGGFLYTAWHMVAVAISLVLVSGQPESHPVAMLPYKGAFCRIR
jgi:hypothetical protein